MNQTKPSDLEAHLGYWLRCLSNYVSSSFAEKLERRGATVAQWVVLRTLYDSRGETLNEAAGRVGVDKSTLSRMVERLVRKGLVRRTEGQDRRSVELALTTAGARLVERLAKEADENDEAFFHTLSHRERAEFLAVIKRLLNANGWNHAARGRDRMA